MCVVLWPPSFISPIIARIKTIFQLLCKDQCSWDKNIFSEIELIWNDFLVDLKQIEILRVERFTFVQPKEKILSISLHGFCHSSSQFYCGVLYIRVETALGIRMSFLMFSNQSNPLKKLSIPLLELLGCVLLSKVLKDELVALKGRFSVDFVYCWSDSEGALFWMKGKEKCWKFWAENK